MSLFVSRGNVEEGDGRMGKVAFDVVIAWHAAA